MTDGSKVLSVVDSQWLIVLGLVWSLMDKIFCSGSVGLSGVVL